MCDVVDDLSSTKDSYRLLSTSDFNEECHLINCHNVNYFQQ